MLPSRDAPQSIAIVTSGLGAGGAEQVIAQLAHHWLSAGKRVEIVSFDDLEDPVYHVFPAEVGLHRLSVAGTAQRVWALRKRLAHIQPDVVVSFLTKINLIAALATFGMDVRLVCSERNNPRRQDAHPFWNQALRLAYRRADLIICQTQGVRRCFGASLQDRIVVIPNPVPAGEAGTGNRQQNRVCAVGRLTRQKGFDRLLEAFAAISHRYPEWNLDIWGEGPDRAALERQIDALGLSGRANLRGLSPQPRSWAAEADVFVLSSRYEGFPNALGEAMAAGLPVAAVDCEFGPADLIEHGVTGLLVPEEDAQDLSRALARLMANAGLRDRLGKAARASVARFRPERVLRLWDAALEPRYSSASPPRSSIHVAVKGR
ncbi:glycosyltransferase family 4 protein [Novosphingobium panipatense]|uniref:Glycosyltransferase involved in cell wall bisynthesis n=1 Tax=Novosphingobium panipatense TaxID=428991 RepID=A0ABY1QLM2_9SPHN|nr:glycosyltransferase family 4 protein [Novosphingobium panipatense]SMP71767.1 Glycosyltransferase involved in cell wall bisynthesis [Novosphingobium panipatense]